MGARLGLTTALLMAFLALPSLAHSIQPNPEKLAGHTVRARRFVQAPPSVSARAAAARVSGRVWWDADTGIAAVVVPDGLRLLPATASDAASYERAAAALLADHAALWGVGSSALELTDIDEAAGVWYLHYQQRFHGLPVVGGGIDLRFKHGNLVLARANTHPDLIVDVVPKHSGYAADKVVHRALSETGWTGLQTQRPPRLVILPRAAQARTGKAVTYHLAWETVTATAWPVGRIVSYVDAHTAELLDQYNEVSYATDTQLTVQGAHEPRAVGQTPVTAPFADVDPAGADGTAIISVEGTQSVDLHLEGPYADIINNETDDAAATVVLDEGVDEVFDWADANSTIVERNAWAAFQTVHARMVEMAPDLAWLDTQVRINVGLDSECNAFWDGTSANFFRESDICNDTGRIADVIYHEVGHGLHQNAMVAGSWDGALSEGSADYLSATITGDPEIAPTFFKTGEGIRDLGPDRVYPSDLTGEVHSDGLIWGGAFWDLRSAMVGLYGAATGVEVSDRLFVDALRGGPTISDGYWEVLVADDDDANLINGTPHVCTINEAFGAHGLGPGPGAGIAFRHEPLGVQPPESATTVATQLFPQFPECGEFDPSSAKLYWRIQGSTVFSEVSLELVDSESSIFEAKIPAVASGSVVEYYFEAGTGDETRVEPLEAPDKFYTYYVGDLITVFEDDFENGENGWTHGFTRAPADPDSQQYADDWQLGTPLGLAGDPDEAFSGDSIWGNDLGHDEFNGAYRPNVTNHLTSPRIDCRGFRGTRLQFRRWLNVEDGTYDQAKIRINGQPVWVNDAGGGSRHHRDANWYFFDIDVSPWADKKVITVEFELFTDSGLQMGGWNIDDFTVVATHTGPVPRSCKCALTQEAPRGPGAPLWLLVLMGTAAAVWRRYRG